MTAGLIGAFLQDNYGGHAGVRRQVFSEWSVHTLRLKENLLQVEILQLFAGEGFYKHTLSHKGLITRMY